ncbi:MAG: citramalate synthase [Microthrixaceae bacterium]|nr:citramalate synthase [Microthrixaceae bacterium]
MNGDHALGPADLDQYRSGTTLTTTPSAVEIFDTTLRDGAQFEGISLTVDDKLRIAEQLDKLGVHWIEGGYPQANPKDAEFFVRAQTELHLSTSTLVAFGSTRRPLGRTDDDPTLRALVEAGTSTVCIVGKGSEFHVTEALRTTTDEGIAMVGESVKFLVGEGLRVFFDAEHFFDGYRQNSEFTLAVLEAAVTNGADAIVLCDTNGGSLPHDVQRVTAEVCAYFGNEVVVGIHAQNDSGCAVANSVAAVVGGSRHVQGTINGYGERTGNANLITVIPDLTFKMGVKTLPEDRLELLTAVSRHVAELVNLPPHAADPYVGSSAFAHKGGLHTSAIDRVGGSTYEHIDPAMVGNATRVLVSDLGGRAGMSMKAREFGVELDSKASAELSEQLKELEAQGFVFEAADASLELLMRQATGWRQSYFDVEAYRVSAYHREDLGSGSLGADLSTEATIKLWVDGERIASVGEGNGPVNALDEALRTALTAKYPELARIHLTDFKVRVIDSSADTGAVTRVLVDSSNGDQTWTTIGVSPNVIEASWMALVDSLVFGLLLADR